MTRRGVARLVGEIQRGGEAVLGVVGVGEVGQRAVVGGEARPRRIVGASSTRPCGRCRGAEHLAVVAASLADVGAEDVHPQLVVGRQLAVQQLVDPRVALGATDGVAPEERRPDGDLDGVVDAARAAG